jgi:magnesium-transporting ATPase (P-type)
MLINECVLTGESVPVVKKAEPVSQLVKKQGDFDKSSILY